MSLFTTPIQVIAKTQAVTVSKNEPRDEMSPAMVMTLKTDCNVECLRLMFRAGATVDCGDGAYCWGDDIDPWLGRKLQNVADDDLVKYEAIQLLIGVTDAGGWSEGCEGRSVLGWR